MKVHRIKIEFHRIGNTIFNFGNDFKKTNKIIEKLSIEAVFK